VRSRPTDLHQSLYFNGGQFQPDPRKFLPLLPLPNLLSVDDKSPLKVFMKVPHRHWQSKADNLAQPLIAPKTYMTLYEFPAMRPKFIYPYPSSFLRAPMRRDILYRAVVYEDNAARGTGGHTKTRGEVRGSTRKIRPQKGSGRARLGSIGSPMLVGGMVPALASFFFPFFLLV